MNASEAPAIRSGDFGAVFGSAFAIWWRTLPTLAVVSLIVLLPAHLVSFGIQAAALPEGVEPSFFGNPFGEPPNLAGEDAARLFGGAIFGALVVGIASIVAVATYFKAVAAAYVGARSSWRETLAHGFARGGSAFWVVLLTTAAALALTLASALPVLTVAAFSSALAIGVGVLAAGALVVALVYLGVSWSPAVPVVLAEERVRGAAALRRSFALVRGRFWFVCAVLVVAGITVGFGNGVVASLLSAPALALDDATAGLAVSTAAGLAAALISTPIWGAFLVVVYFDLRAHKEGAGLEDLAHDIGLRRDPDVEPLAPRPVAPPPWPHPSVYPPPPYGAYSPPQPPRAPDGE